MIGRCLAKHRSQEFRAFLELVEKSVPADQEVHLVLDILPRSTNFHFEDEKNWKLRESNERS